MVKKYQGFELLKPCLELSKKWRTSRSYKSLEGTLLIAGKDGIIELDSSGNVLLHEEFRSIGSGSVFAETSAEMLYRHTDFSVQRIAEESMQLAAKRCVYTNDSFIKQRMIW